MAALAGHVEMAPAPPRTVMDLPADLPATRTDRAAATQRDADRDAVWPEKHIDDAGALQRQQGMRS